jgi:hypothetical protein
MTFLVLAALLQSCAGGSQLAPVRTLSGSVDPYARRALQLTRNTPGSRMALQLRDSTEVEGRFQGVDRMSADEYQKRVDDFRAASGDSVPFPAPGYDVLVYFKGSKTETFRLVGFGMRSLEVRGQNGRDLLPVEFETFQHLSDLRATLWPSALLADMADHGQLPTASQVVIDTKNGRREIPLDRIETTQAKRSVGGRLIGTLIAMATMCVIVASAYLVNTKK